MAEKKEKTVLSWDYEISTGAEIVCGVDEAGRGPLVGRVYAAAVILPYDKRFDETILALNDSKKLSAKKREYLSEKIKEIAVSYAISYSEVPEIEELNILNASLLAMRRSIAALRPAAQFALIDGNICRGFDIPARAVVGGDALSPSIAAASILAKVARDTYCDEVLHKLYPEYNFAKHKGYGTREHYAAIEKYGVCPEHRLSFLKKLGYGKE